jgi:NAD(P)-dependent dehydrogenase (short-subunit alcohol dehydrogenase family)
MMTKRFQDRVALVTAAAAGIGAATATAFAQAGAHVMLSDINEAAGQEMAERLRAGGANVRFLRADATDEAEVERLVRTTVEAFGGLHIAANVVGDAHRGASGPEFHLQSLESWEWTQAVSLRSVFLCMKHEIMHMIANNGGVITNITSLAAHTHVPESGAAYAAAKAGVTQLTRFAAVAYADRNVRVNCIAPGVTPTAGYEKAGPEVAKMIIDRLVQYQPIKRTIDPSEQAAGILWLSSDESSMVTGHMLPIDGGWTAT